MKQEIITFKRWQKEKQTRFELDTLAGNRKQLPDRALELNI